MVLFLGAQQMRVEFILPFFRWFSSRSQGQKPQMDYNLQMKVMYTKILLIYWSDSQEVKRPIPHNFSNSLPNKASADYFSHMSKFGEQSRLQWRAHMIAWSNSIMQNNLFIYLFPNRLSAVQRKYYRRRLALVRLNTDRKHLRSSERHVSMWNSDLFCQPPLTIFSWSQQHILCKYYASCDW